jgi:hypothetical protein
MLLPAILSYCSGTLLPSLWVMLGMLDRLDAKKEVQIVAIGPRATIYEETYHLIKRIKAAKEKNP